MLFFLTSREKESFKKKRILDKSKALVKRHLEVKVVQSRVCERQ